MSNNNIINNNKVIIIIIELKNCPNSGLLSGFNLTRVLLKKFFI